MDESESNVVAPLQGFPDRPFEQIFKCTYYFHPADRAQDP